MRRRMGKAYFYRAEIPARIHVPLYDFRPHCASAATARSSPCSASSSDPKNFRKKILIELKRIAEGNPPAVDLTEKEKKR